RHTHGSMLAMRAVPMAVIAEQLGHTGTRMTEKHYAHLAPNYVADTIRAHFPTLGITGDTNVFTMKAKKRPVRQPDRREISSSNVLNRSRRGAGWPTVAGHDHHRRPACSAPALTWRWGGGSMAYVPDWERLSDALKRVVTAGIPEDQGKSDISRAIADGKIRMRLFAEMEVSGSKSISDWELIATHTAAKGSTSTYAT